MSWKMEMMETKWKSSCTFIKYM